MTLLDAYALVAFLVGGPPAPQVRGLLREGQTSVATANLAEALDVSARTCGLPVDRAMEVLEPLLDGTLGSVSLDVQRARRAASIRAHHYHRSARPISLADAILIASADRGDQIATADPDVLAVAEAEAIAIIRLRSQGCPAESTALHEAGGLPSLLHTDERLTCRGDAMHRWES